MLRMSALAIVRGRLPAEPVPPPRPVDRNPLFQIRHPNRAQVLAVLEDCAGAPFSYPEIGSAGGAPPEGYAVDRYSADLGRGDEVLERTRAAIWAFAMYPPRWTSIITLGEKPTPAPDLVFASVIHHLGFWSINPGRVIETIDQEDCAGFSFGTLPGHSKCGEERFRVVCDHDGTVRFEALAFSRPAALLARLGVPLARGLQRRFARDAKRAMRDSAMAETNPVGPD